MATSQNLGNVQGGAKCPCSWPPWHTRTARIDGLPPQQTFSFLTAPTPVPAIESFLAAEGGMAAIGVWSFGAVDRPRSGVAPNL